MYKRTATIFVWSHCLKKKRQIQKNKNYNIIIHLYLNGKLKTKKNTADKQIIPIIYGTLRYYPHTGENCWVFFFFFWYLSKMKNKFQTWLKARRATSGRTAVAPYSLPVRCRRIAAQIPKSRTSCGPGHTRETYELRPHNNYHFILAYRRINTRKRHFCSVRVARSRTYATD